MGLQVVLLHLAGSPEQLATSLDRTEEQDQVLVEQTVDVEGDWVGETTATLLTLDSHIFRLLHLLEGRVSVLCALSWMTFRQVKEGRLGILLLKGRVAILTVEEKGSRGSEVRPQLVHFSQFVSQSPVTNQQGLVNLVLNLQRLLQLSNTNDG